MATASTSSSLRYSEEKTNGFKLMRLIIDGGTEALRNVFQSKLAGELLNVLGFHRPTLEFLKTKKIITPPQWKLLYPPIPMIPNIKEFDITLLFLLLRNICGISAPIGTKWDNMPKDTDHSEKANIVRIKLFRNKFFGHTPDISVSTAEFEDRWKEVSTTLYHLGISQVEIDRLKDEECGQEEVDRIRREWSENDTKVGLQLLGIKKTLKQVNERLDDIETNVKSLTQDKQPSEDILNKHLNFCDFDSNIKLLYQKWCKDTREWVFHQVREWFNDTTSERRAFIITGQPGMGKSVIAAVICKRFAGQLAACHFCQYNNDRYNNIKILFQSLAKQLSDVLPEYKKALIQKLSCKAGPRLKDMNVQGLFATLFKEPLRNIDVAENYLIVIDAVDESEHEGKNDLVDVIADYLDQLPSFIRFLITSRLENNISKKFEKLNPMFLLPNDEQNVKDIQRLFEDKLSQAKAKDISSLIEKCEGVMLFANYVLEIVDNCSPMSDIDDLPTGIEGVYTSYFKRWEREFQDVEVPVHEFLSFLGIMAVAKEPLPETLVAKVFDSDNSSLAIAKRKMHKIKNCLSLLLVIQQDRLTFFHKSVKDWLVECDHEFTVDEKFGHETIANICAREMDELKKKVIKPPFHPAAEYALLYGIQHKLAGTQRESMKSFINRYVTDLEIMYASINVDVYATFNNIRSVAKDAIYSSVPEEARRTVETFMLLIRKYSNTFQDFPQSFLQHVLNWGGEDLAKKAASLLNYRYKDLIYFEHIEKDSLETSLVCRIFRSAIIISLAISPSEDYLVCWNDNDEIELFSIEDFKSLWTIVCTDPTPLYDMEHLTILPSRIAFHPLRNVILPGRLDRVINFQGKFEPGPFSCNNINPLFEDCCFSNDNSKMATTYGSDLTVWNLESSESLQSFSSDHDFLSISFSANGRFFATSDNGNRVVVYDLERDYICKQKSFLWPIIFVSTFKSDSWYCYTGHNPVDFDHLYTVRHDLSALTLVDRLYQCTPLNVKATAEFEDFFGNPHLSGEHAWFEMGSGWSNFFCLNNGIALVWLTYSPEFKFYRISKLKEPQSVQNYHDIAHYADIDFSVDGKLIYMAEPAYFWVYQLDSNYAFRLSLKIKQSYIPFAPVKNGVFFCKKTGNSMDRLASCGYPIAVPELWNSELTQHLDSFPKLSATEKCLAVSPEIVACITIGQVYFFNVVQREIVSKTCVPRHTKVTTCSSKYHVVLVNNASRSLWRDGKVVGELVGAGLHYWSHDKGIFSPNSKTLALTRGSTDPAVYIFDVALARLRHRVHFEFFYDILHIGNTLQFLDEDHLFCRAYATSVCIINASSGNALSCLNISNIPTLFRVIREPDNGSVLLCLKTFNNTIKLIKVWLPR